MMMMIMTSVNDYNNTVVLMNVPILLLSSFVPCNMVSEVQVDDDHVAEELFREQQRSNNNGLSAAAVAAAAAAAAAATSNSSGRKAANGNKDDDDDRWGDIYESSPARQKLALYDYEPSELSPNVDSEVELPFRTGDLIHVYGELDEDGFYLGELNGRRGLVPSNFLTDVPPGCVKLMLQNKNRFVHVQ